MLKVRPFLLRYRRRPNIQQGLYGGQDIKHGFSITRRSQRKVPRQWLPNGHSKTYFSDILDQDITTMVSTEAMSQIDRCKGFDNYILFNPPKKLNSELGETLREKMHTVLKENECEFYIPYFKHKLFCEKKAAFDLKDKVMKILNRKRRKNGEIEESKPPPSGPIITDVNDYQAMRSHPLPPSQFTYKRLITSKNLSTATTDADSSLTGNMGRSTSQSRFFLDFVKGVISMGLGRITSYIGNRNQMIGGV